MARESISVQLTNDFETRPEGVGIVARGHVWRSSGGGWLPVQEGIWEEVLNIGIDLHGRTITKEPIARLLQCHFETVNVNDQGTATYHAQGATGRWLVNSVYP